MKEIITLTIGEIINLARFAGLVIDPETADDPDDLDVEISIGPVPEKGLSADGVEGIKYNGHMAWFYEYPEEGVMPLGEKI